MLIRLRYAVLLAGALLAILVGLWPSLLTLGALLAVPLAFVALAGLLRPAFIEKRRSLRRFAAVGGALIGLELAVLLVVIAWTPRRPVLLVTQSPVPPRVRVVYNLADGAPRSWWRWGRRYQVPAAGVIYSQYSMDRGWYRPADPHPVRAVANAGTGQFDTVPVAWVRGGTTQAGPCTLEYDEFVLGDTARLVGRTEDVSPRGGWLDSLSTWGVECRDGRLYRIPPGRPSELRRTGPPCYYDRTGIMVCGLPPAAP